MKVRLLIAGSRNIDYGYINILNRLLIPRLDKLECIVSGMARGADMLGYKFAKTNNIPVKEFPAKWDIYGKSAGYKRNQQMAEYLLSDSSIFPYAIVLWDGVSKGTKHMIDILDKANIQYKIINI
ncbi:hypothetical protein ACT6CD_08505 [Campylobacter coli]|uniref:hypothetical protein n=1 Tax=Campylobacter coli TaxID=195 RepID=UPI004034315B